MIEITTTLLKKYVTDIEIADNWDSIRNGLNERKILNIKRKQKGIQQFIRERFEKFNDNIGKHLDNLLERRQIIDTSYVHKDGILVTDTKEVKEYFQDYYYEFFKSDCSYSTNIEIDALEYIEKIKITQEINFQEYTIALKSLATNMASASSGIKTEMLLLSPMKIHEWLIHAFNWWMKLGNMPKHLLRNQIWLIPKEMYKGDALNTRPINLIEIPRKLFSTIIVRRLSYQIESNALFESVNFGFRPGMSTVNAIKTLQIIIEHAKIRKKLFV